MAIKFGVCTKFSGEGDDVYIKNLGEISALGYDYVELQATAVFALSESECKKVAKDLAQNNILALAANIALPPQTKIVGDEVDFVKISQYFEIVMAKLQILGIEKLVLGSGKSREIPKNFDKNTAKNQIIKALRIMADIAQKHNITIVIEPLNKGETNVINSVIEACEYAKEVARDNVKVLADYYHMCIDGESAEVLSEISNYGTKLHHVHIANPKGRVYPTKDEDYSKFFSALMQIGYDQTVSIEGGSEDILADCKKSMELFKSL